MSDEEIRKLAAIMLTDMVGYSALSQRDDKLALELLEEHREILRKIFPEFHGTEIKTIGDAFLVEFQSALEAAECSIAIQRTLAHRNADAPAGRQIQVKIGIHIGDVVHRGGDVYGDGVNIASRIEPLAGAGGICVSMDVERQIRNALETRFEKLAPTELKNISVPMELFRIVLPWEKKSEVRSQKSEARGKNRALPVGAIGALAILLIIAIAIGWWWTTRPHKNSAVASSVSENNQSQNVPDKSIAVLPFENLSDDKSNAYFAEGIQDEILTKLASIADLKVISRTSTAKYQSKPENLKVVSQQLGAANLLEGTVQRAADKVRVNVQLIDARSDSHLWAKSYDREAKDVFAVESEVSQEVADALQAKLSPHEADALAATPTKDPQAYDLFLKAEYEERQAEGTLKAAPFDRAAALYHQALERDPNFALAAARLANSVILRHWFIRRLNDADLAEVKRIADRAVTLAPNLPEAHIALGSFYYYGKSQYDEALREFSRAIELEPNNVRAAEVSGYVHRRQGRWQLSLDELNKCQELDPLDASLAAELASSYGVLRMWPEAKRGAVRALSLDPTNNLAMATAVDSCLNGVGDIDEAKRIAAPFRPPKITDFLALNISATPLYPLVIERDFSAALKACESKIADPDEERSRLMARVVLHLLAGDVAADQQEIETAQGLVEARLREKPDEPFAIMQSAWINLERGHKAEALLLAARAAELQPIKKDALTGPAVLTAQAQVQARADQPAEATKILQHLLAIPAGLPVTIARLRTDPVWDPIRDDPSFQLLLTGKELVGPPDR